VARKHANRKVGRPKNDKVESKKEYEHQQRKTPHAQDRKTRHGRDNMYPTQIEPDCSREGKKLEPLRLVRQPRQWEKDRNTENVKTNTSYPHFPRGGEGTTRRTSKQKRYVSSSKGEGQEKRTLRPLFRLPSREQKIYIALRLSERISRGMYGTSGECPFAKPTIPDEKSDLNVSVRRRRTGNY